MASYPTTNKTFASRANGTVIDASHVQDLQDEVAALEDGLLNGSARLNSSHSTVANLSVLGGSTVAGGLTVAGGSTLTGPVTLGAGIASTVTFASSVTFLGNVTVTGTLTATVAGAAVPSVHVTSSANTPVPNATWVSPNWDVESYNSTTPMHSTSVNSSRITFADSTGRYHVGFAVAWAAGAGGGGTCQARVMLNDATGVVAAYATGINVVLPQTGCADLRVTSTTDYVTVQVLQDLGSSRSLQNSTTYNAMAFWAHKISS